MDRDREWELEALEGLLSDPSAEPIKLSYGLLKYITDNFSNEIGRGGFGVVYLGDLRNGAVAVKRSNGLNVTDKQFMDEIKCLKSANHKNIVRFLGYCADTQEEVMPLDGTFVMAGKRNRLFCFEYVPNGNIRQYLEQEKSHGDDWPTRYQMIRGVCQGLQFLHDKQINHLDLKPENVMLDAHMEAKITDFGLSRFLDHGQSRIITKHICGTLRYIAPEVINRSELSFKSDIYALGIIIIELLTGTSMISLRNWDESLDLLDCPRAGMCAEIARNCMHAERDNRPTIREVIHRMNELESMIPKSSTTNQLVTATAFPGTKMLDVYPTELRFLFQPNKGTMRCSVTMTNKTDNYVHYLLFPKHAETINYGTNALLPPMYSSVARVDIDVGEELPSDMVEWEILMFTMALSGNVEVIRAQMSLVLAEEEDLTYVDQIRVLHEFFGGVLHRTALTASVVVDSDVELEMHSLERVFSGGKLQRAALTASVVEDSDVELEMHSLDREFSGGKLQRAALTASVVEDSDVERTDSDDDEFIEITLDIEGDKVISVQENKILSVQENKILSVQEKKTLSVQENKILVPEENEDIAIDSMDVHPTEPWVLLVAGNRVHIWNWQTTEKVGEYNSPAELGQSNKEMRSARYSVAKFIAREQWVVTGDDDGAITVLKCPTLGRVNRFKAHSDSISLFAVHPTRPFLLSFCLPFSLKLWDWSCDWSCSRIFDVRSRLRKIMFNPRDTTTFATRGEDGLVQMWKIGRLNSVATTHSRDGREGGHLFTYTGKQDCIASVDDDPGSISVWDMRKEKHVYTLHSGGGDIVAAVCHPTRPILVTVSSEGCIQVWDSTTYRLKMAYDNLPVWPIHLGFTGSARLVIGHKEGIAMMGIDLK